MLKHPAHNRLARSYVSGKSDDEFALTRCQNGPRHCQAAIPFYSKKEEKALLSVVTSMPWSVTRSLVYVGIATAMAAVIPEWSCACQRPARAARR
jgi:hypothetical protein